MRTRFSWGRKYVSSTPSSGAAFLFGTGASDGGTGQSACVSGALPPGTRRSQLLLQRRSRAQANPRRGEGSPSPHGGQTLTSVIDRVYRADASPAKAYRESHSRRL